MSWNDDNWVSQPVDSVDDLSANTAIQVVKIAAVALSGHRAVLLDTNKQAIYADNATLAHANRVYGITISAADAGQEINIVTRGEIEEPSWNWDVTLPIFLGTNGTLVQIPSAAGYTKKLGYAISPTRMFVNINQHIILV